MSKTPWKRIGAAGGIAFVVLQLVAQILIQIGAPEPSFDASAEAILAFFQAKNLALIPVADFLSAVSAIALLWFVGSLWTDLRSAEEGPGFLSTVAGASGIVMLAVISSGSGWALAVFRIDEGLDPQLARYLFDQGNYTFATLWVFTASLLLASGIAGFVYQVFPTWLAWLGVVDAALLLIVRANWASPSGVVFLPYVLFWVWLIATSVVLMRRPAAR